VLGQLAGGVGHDLRNPLGVINNAVYYLKMVQTDAADNIKEYLDIIGDEIKTAEGIVADLLDFARTKPPNLAKTNLSVLITSVLQRNPAPQEVEIIQQIPPDLPPIYIDSHQIGRVLDNLINNAFQAMPDGGQLSLSVGAHNDSIQLSISDTGVGISSENKTKIFEPLFTTKSAGFGLGLAIVKNLVEVNHGTIEVESQLGTGSVFTITLPILNAHDGNSCLS
jgi:signal transduction histidine kinase